MKTDNPSFDDLDIDIPNNCSKVEGHKWGITCDDGKWGCLMRKNSGSPVKYWTRCTNVKLNVSYFYTIEMNPFSIVRRCYAHTTNENDKPNRLCKVLTNKTTHGSAEGIAMFWQPTGPWVQSYGYSF